MQNSNFEREVLDRLITIEEKIDDYKDLKKDTAMALSMAKENEKEIYEIQDKIRFLSRTITTAIITGLVGIIFIFIKLGMGVK